MSNNIEIYQNNSKTLTCVVNGLSDITDMSTYFTVKKNMADTSYVIDKVGTVVDASGTFKFDLTPEDTSLNAQQYFYDINIEDGVNIYTVVKDTLKIIEGVRY